MGEKVEGDYRVLDGIRVAVSRRQRKCRRGALQRGLLERKVAVSLWPWRGVSMDGAQKQQRRLWQELFHWREEEEKSTCRRKSGLTVEGAEFSTMNAKKEGPWAGAANNVDIVQRSARQRLGSGLRVRRLYSHQLALARAASVGVEATSLGVGWKERRHLQRE